MLSSLGSFAQTELAILSDIWQHRLTEAVIAVLLISHALTTLLIIYIVTPHSNIKPKKKTKPAPLPLSSSSSSSSSSSLPHTIALITSIIVPSILYLASTPSSVYLVDAGSLSLAAYLPGVAHPPGFPAWTAIAHLVLAIPTPIHISVAYKLNLLSGFLGCLSVHLVWRVSHLWIARADCHHRRPPRAPWTRELPPLLAALSCAAAWPMWMFSTTTEVYTLTSFTLLLSILLLAKCTDSPPTVYSAVIYLAAGASFGVAGSAHHVTAALALPALCYLAARNSPTLAWRNIGLCAIGALGVGVYFYVGFMYGIAKTRPLWSWGGAVSWEKLLSHVTGKQYSVNLLGDIRWPTVRLELLRVLWVCVFSLSPCALLVGWRAVMSARSPHADDGGGPSAPSILVAEKTFLLILVLPALLFVFVYVISEDKEGYLVTLCWASSIALGIGTHEILTAVTNTPPSSKNKAEARKVWLVAGLIFIGPLLVFLQNLSNGGCYRPNDHRATDIVTAVVSTLPPRSLLLLKDFQVYSPWLYLHHVEGVRPDLMVVDTLLVMRSWYLDYLSVHAAPLMNSSSVKRREAEYRRRLAPFEASKAYDGEKIQTAFLGFINALIHQARESGSSIYYLPQLGVIEQGISPGDVWVPHGLPFIGYGAGERMSEAGLRVMKLACVKADEATGRQWIRHAWDIEGYKLHALFVQSLQSRVEVLKNILMIQAKGEVAAVFSEQDVENAKKLLQREALALQQHIPINVKYAG